MSGHSHWAGIKHKKALVDSKRGRVFSKLARRITLAAKAGGGDPSSNLHLEYAIMEAKAANMTKDSIERAIKKGTGELGPVDVVELTYEGYAPGGVALVIEAATDNKNRTASEVRFIMERHGGNLGGGTAWQFEKKGLILVRADQVNEDDLLALALENGAEDMQQVGEQFQITCAPGDLMALRRALEAKGVGVESANLSSIPQTTVPVDEDTGRKVVKLLEALEENDDVENVYANVELPTKLLAEMAHG